MSQPPAFQFYASDFLSDGAVMEMTYEERGVYITLLAIAWREDGVPTEHDRLRRLLRLSLAQFEELWPAVAPCWTQDGERLVNPRMERERVSLNEWREKSAKAGRRSGESRRAKSNQSRTKDEPIANTSSSPSGEVRSRSEGSNVVAPENGATQQEPPGGNAKIPPTAAQHPNGDGARAAPDGAGERSSSLDEARTVRDLFDHWRERCNHPASKFTPERKGKIRARLRDGYTSEFIRQAIDGAAVAAYVDERGKRHDDIELICRNGTKLESFAERSELAGRITLGGGGRRDAAGERIRRNLEAARAGA